MVGIVNTKANALTKLLNKQNKIAKLSGPKVDVLSNAKSDVLSALYTKIVVKNIQRQKRKSNPSKDKEMEKICRRQKAGKLHILSIPIHFC